MSEIIRINKDDIVPSVDPQTSKEIIAEVSAQNAILHYRLDPYDNLSDREIEIWDEVVSSVVVGHLTNKDKHQLANYCRVYAQIEFIDTQIELMKQFNIDPFDKAHYTAFAKWMGMRKEAMATLLAHSRAMRLTNSAFRTDETKAGQIIEHGDALAVDDYE